MLSLIVLQITFLFSTAAFAPEELIFSAPPPPPPTSSQSLTLHTGWNLVSWNIVPMTQPIAMQDILPTSGWFGGTGANKLYKHDDSQVSHYYPLYGGSESWVWDVNYAYYMRLEQPPSTNWSFSDQPLINRLSFTINPSAAWDDSCDVLRPDSYTNGWFFMGYSPPGYCKLATIFNTTNPPNGGPTYNDYVGPLHWLMWYNDSPNNYPHRGVNDQYLIIVKDDQGKVYIPYDPNSSTETQEVDQIGVLEPGRGYFLGFRRPTTPIDFAGWEGYPGWPENSLPPDPKVVQAQTASGSHFQFTKYTQWSYPVVIDTVDLNQTPMVQGDEIGIFDGNLCVGAGAFQGSFPLVIPTW
ncbi:MAG: hypothetical protein NTW14_03790, partial [bacterium]|nr:hypothetical protein [bacterium]